MSNVRLVVGLGNPGSQYDQTRHNVGFWFVDQLAREHGGFFRTEAKFHGEALKTRIAGEEVWLLKPTTFMNKSGQSIRALANFYKIKPEEILVVHDELDLPPGRSRLKKEGGHGGHNGLRDTIAQLGSKAFLRLRVGIGHPGDRHQVVNYVLNAPGKGERIEIDRSLDDASRVMETLVSEGLEKAMHALHSSN